MSTKEMIVDRGVTDETNMINLQPAVEIIQQDSPLLDLPAELRDDIDQRVICTSEPAVSLLDLKRMPRTLLHVCRQIRDEASPIYYGRALKNSIDCSSPEHGVIRYLRKIGIANCALIRRLELRSRGSMDNLLNLYIPVDEERLLQLARTFAEQLYNTGVRVDKVVCSVSGRTRTLRERFFWAREVGNELRRLSERDFEFYDRQTAMSVDA